MAQARWGRAGTRPAVSSGRPPAAILDLLRRQGPSQIADVDLGVLLTAAAGQPPVSPWQIQSVADAVSGPASAFAERAQAAVSAAIAGGAVRTRGGKLSCDPRAIELAMLRLSWLPAAAASATRYAARQVETPTAARSPTPTRTGTGTRRATAARASTARPKPGVTPPRTAGKATAAPQVALAPAPAWTPVPTRIHTPDPAELEAQLAAQPGSLAAFRHTQGAHALASASAFDELISLGQLVGITSHRYQIDAVRRVLRALGGRALLADEVGLGKTIEAVIALREYQLRGMARRILVLSPAALVRHWVGELAAKAGIDAASTDDPQLRSAPEAFWQQDGVVVASLGTARTAKNAPLVTAAPWDLVIVDEAHHIKRRTSLGWKLVDALRSRFLLLLTATPVESDIDDIYSLVTLLRPGHFATAAAFRAQFVDAKDPSSLRNREQLRALLGQVMVRNTRAGCGLGLPPRFVSTISVEPLPAEQTLYLAVLAALRRHAGARGSARLFDVLLLEAGSSPAAVASTLERALARGDRDAAATAELHELLALARAATESRKRTALLEIAATHPGEQMLVFTRYRSTVAFIAAGLRTAGIDHVVFEGGLSPTERARVLDAFATGTRVMVATDVGGEGQNLQHCHVLVDFDLPWNPMLIEQRIGRLHRMGQQHEVRVYNLANKGTIDDRLLDVLDRRLHLFELVVGEMDMVLGNLADERDLEERLLALAAESDRDEELDAGFAAIEDELRAARSGYEKSRALDDALFGEEFET